MSEDVEQLGEIKIEGCLYRVYRKKDEPGIVNLEGVSCDIRESLERGNKLIDVLFSGAEVRYKAPKLVTEEDQPSAVVREKMKSGGS